MNGCFAVKIEFDFFLSQRFIYINIVQCVNSHDIVVEAYHFFFKRHTTILKCLQYLGYPMYNSDICSFQFTFNTNKTYRIDMKENKIK